VLPDCPGHGAGEKITMMPMIILIAFIIIAILILLEAAMYCLIRYPAVLRRFPRKLQNSISYLYIQGDRKIMQFQEGCGRYHPDLGYTLQPGAFVFTEIEFSNEYKINSLGVRDTEESLREPEIIFLGDSFALGWGVDQAETFVMLLRGRTKCKTLNTSVPSYGTVREMLMLRKVDRSRLKCLIIQYCGDDYDENRLFYTNGNRPQIMRAATFKNLTTLHSKAKTYFPGKYIWIKIRKKIEEWKWQPAKAASDHHLNDVELFIHVLKQNADMLVNFPLIVFEMNGINQTNTFTRQLKEKANESGQPPFIRNMIVLDMSQYLEDRHFYVLDGHLNASGHMIVADILYQTISQAGII
jgi:hypothetical protein